MRRPTSLRAVAVGWLAQREHSERELRRKLLTRLRRADAAEATRAASGQLPAPNPVEPAEAQTKVDAVIAWLIEQGYLDERRFVESRVHARAARFGSARIAHELAQHGVELDPDAALALRGSEFERARAVWQRRFGGMPVAGDVRAAARQARFLAGRGFAAEVIWRVLRSAGTAGDADPDGD